MSTNIISIKCLEQIEDIFELKKSWNELHQSCTAPSIYNGFDFVYESLRSFTGEKISNKIFTLTDISSNQLIAIFPMQQIQLRWHIFRFNSYDYAAMDEIDKPYPVIRHGYFENCWSAFIHHIKNNVSDCDHLHLIEMPSNNQEIEMLPSICSEHNLIFKIYPDEQCPIISLDGDWDEYWSQHRKMRKKIRKIEKDFEGRLKFTVHTDNWEWCLNQYIELEQKSWKKGKVGISKNKFSINFYKRFCEKLNTSGNLQFGFLTIDDELVSAEIAYTQGNTVYFCHGCYDNNHKKYSPGMASTSYFIKHFYNSKYSRGDYLCGYAGYLNNWSDSVIKTNSLDIYRKNTKMCSMLAARSIKNKTFYPVRRLLKKAYEVVWRRVEPAKR